MPDDKRMRMHASRFAQLAMARLSTSLINELKLMNKEKQRLCTSYMSASGREFAIAHVIMQFRL